MVLRAHSRRKLSRPNSPGVKRYLASTREMPETSNWSRDNGAVGSCRRLRHVQWARSPKAACLAAANRSRAIPHHCEHRASPIFDAGGSIGTCDYFPPATSRHGGHQAFTIVAAVTAAMGVIHGVCVPARRTESPTSDSRGTY